MEKIKAYWLDFFQKQPAEDNWWKRKRAMWESRNGIISHVQGKAEKYRSMNYDDKRIDEYVLYLNFLIKQGSHFHLEEQTMHYRIISQQDKIIQHEEIQRKGSANEDEPAAALEAENTSRQDFTYDRREAVRYAERYWNSYNPAFRVFEDDCTNFISQCLYHGGAPMRGMPIRNQGWWYRNDSWSFSWAVAHSLRWYLSGSRQGLRGKELDRPEDLLPGDVICYDFQGDGRWDHTTIVVNKDANGMPLVNAHTNNSRNRYWTYEDSAAWTPNIQYKFFRIGE